MPTQSRGHTTRCSGILPANLARAAILSEIRQLHSNPPPAPREQGFPPEFSAKAIFLPVTLPTPNGGCSHWNHHYSQPHAVGIPCKALVS
jgi:hypothetical protein